MKETTGTGELNITVITIVAIAAIAVVFVALWPTIKEKFNGEFSNVIEENQKVTDDTEVNP